MPDPQSKQAPQSTRPLPLCNSGRNTQWGAQLLLLMHNVGGANPVLKCSAIVHGEWLLPLLPLCKAPHGVGWGGGKDRAGSRAVGGT
jgi:hypothetical protein